MSRRNVWGLLFVAAVVVIAIGLSVFMGIRNYDMYGRPINLGLDLQGGIHLVLEVMPPPGEELSEERLDDVEEALRRRVDELGVSEAVVERLKGDDSRRIAVELPGITDIDSARQVLGSQGVLLFKLEGEIIPGLTGNEHLVGASPGWGGDFGNVPALKLEFDDEGGRILRNLSRDHINDILSIHLDEAEIVSGRIVGELGNKVEVTGQNVTMEWAKNAAAILRGGTLPAPIKELESRSVSATLGQRIISLSLTAGIVGILLVLVFMIVIYKLPGLVADIALLVYMMIVYAAFVGVGASLTLPGIAGVILSIGMAVDANVIIFERIKDERQSGKRIRAAIESGFRRALTAVIDANVTTLIVAAILFYFGAGKVQGFALTLSIGILASMFSAIMVTRILLSAVVDRDPEKYSRYFPIKEEKQHV